MPRRVGTALRLHIVIGDTNVTAEMRLPLKSLHAIIVAFVFISGCQTLPSYVKQPLAENGELYLYLQPLPQEADRLSFALAGISATNKDGSDFPLMLELKDLRGSDAQRQRFLAVGRLPAGDYTGISFKVNKATLKTEDGEASLAIPESAVRTDVSFTVNKKKALLITLTLNYKNSLRDEVKFSPLFSTKIPGKPVPGLVGYVSNYADNSLTVVDKQSMLVTGIIATGRGPKGMAFDQLRRKAYVAISEEDAIEVVDIPTGEVLNRISLNTGDNPQELALSPDGRTLVSTNAGTNSVSIIDPVSFFETGRVNVGDGPSSILIDPTGKRAYVFNTLANTISVIDLSKRAIVSTIVTEPWPVRGQFNRSGDALYVIQRLSSYLTVLNPASLVVTKRKYIGTGANAVKVDSNTDQIYVGKQYEPWLAVYDPFSFLPGDSIKAGSDNAYLTIDGEGNNLCVVDAGRKSLLFINLVSRKVVGEIDVGEAPYWVSLMGER